MEAKRRRFALRVVTRLPQPPLPTALPPLLPGNAPPLLPAPPADAPAVSQYSATRTAALSAPQAQPLALLSTLSTLGESKLGESKPNTEVRDS